MAYYIDGRPYRIRRRFLASGIASGEWSLADNAILYDDFLTAEAAPLTTPRDCEPGPGTLTIIDTGNNADIVGGEQVWSGLAGVGDPAYYGAVTQATRVPGLSIFINVKSSGNSRSYFGLNTVYTNSPTNTSFYEADTTISSRDSDIVALGSLLTSGAYHSRLIVMRSAGSFFILNGRLLWVGNNSTTNDDVAIFAASSAISSLSSKIFAAVNLATTYNPIWGPDFSKVTDTKTNPASTTTFDVDADCHVNYTFTPENTKYAYIHGRYTDPTHFGWRVECGTDGTAYVKYRSGGGLQTLYTGVGVFPDGVAAQVDVVVEGVTLRLYVDNVLKTTETLVYNLTTTGGYVVHILASNDIVLSTHPYPSLGIATDRVIAPQQSDTFTHTNNFLAFFRNVTLPAATDGAISFRRVDADNRLWLKIFDDGSAVLYEEIATVNNARFTAGPGSISDGDDVALLVNDGSAELFAAGTSIGSTSGITTILTGTAGFFKTWSDGMAADSIELFPDYPPLPAALK